MVGSGECPSELGDVEDTEVDNDNEGEEEEEEDDVDDEVKIDEAFDDVGEGRLVSRLLNGLPVIPRYQMMSETSSLHWVALQVKRALLPAKTVNSVNPIPIKVAKLKMMLIVMEARNEKMKDKLMIKMDKRRVLIEQH